MQLFWLLPLSVVFPRVLRIKRIMKQKLRNKGNPTPVNDFWRMGTTDADTYSLDSLSLTPQRVNLVDE